MSCLTHRAWLMHQSVNDVDKQSSEGLTLEYVVRGMQELMCTLKST